MKAHIDWAVDNLKYSEQDPVCNMLYRMGTGKKEYEKYKIKNGSRTDDKESWREVWARYTGP